MTETSSFDSVTQNDLRELLSDRPGPAVSIYQPVHRAGPETEQNPLRFKNLVGNAEDKLVADGTRRPVACDILAPARSLLERSSFWRRNLDGLAVFTAPGYFRAFKLPFAVEELVVVAPSPHVTPLLPAMTQGHFYVLAISMDSVRLLRATRHQIEELGIEGAPTSLKEAMKYDDFQKSNLQRHPTSRAGAGGRTMQHGHGPGEEDIKDEIRRFFQAVDAKIAPVLRADGAPLVIAAVDYLIPMYRNLSSYKNIVARGVEGNPDQVSPRDLVERSLPIVETIFREPVNRARDKYGSGTNSGLASCELPEVLGAAHTGRVESLMIARGERRWGNYDVQVNKIDLRDEPSQGDADLLDLATRQSLLHGGDVYLLDAEEMPCDGPIAAVFRY
jgi:Bacterial archaeo-eukaryotic release factor family 7